MAELKLDPLVMAGEGWADYGLIDSGHGRKFECYGVFRFIRPEPQAMWSPRLAEWDAHGEFVPGSDEDGGGRWHFFHRVPREGWPLAWNEVGFTAQCTPFRHLGFFPDMAPVWEWMRGQLEGRGDAARSICSAIPGSARLALSQCGPVTHVDASKKSVAGARENAGLSEMQDRPVRWLVDDAAKFTAREVRRGKRYDGIILDPPACGRGPEGEVWRLEESLPRPDRRLPCVARCGEQVPVPDGLCRAHVQHGTGRAAGRAFRRPARRDRAWRPCRARR